MSWGRLDEPWRHPGYGRAAIDAAAEAQRRVDEQRAARERFEQSDLSAYMQLLDDVVADVLGVPRRDRGWRDTPEPETKGPVRIIWPGSLEYQAVTSRVRHVLGPVDPCRFPGVAPKITSMQ